MFLNQRARELLRAYSMGLAAEYGQDSAERYFSLTDPKETALRAALLESVDFLSMITVADVD
ncbi:P2 family phage major capsid protein, partial [Serratia ureilytica]